VNLLIKKLTYIKREEENDAQYQAWKAKQIAEKGYITDVGESRWLNKNRPDIKKVIKSLKWSDAEKKA